MKVSELIQRLQQAMVEYGDLPVEMLVSESGEGASAVAVTTWLRPEVGSEYGDPVIGLANFEIKAGRIGA